MILRNLIDRWSFNRLRFCLIDRGFRLLFDHFFRVRLFFFGFFTGEVTDDESRWRRVGDWVR